MYTQGYTNQTNTYPQESLFFSNPTHGKEKSKNKYLTGVQRYGFNGMEKDDEVKGNDNSYTTEFRQYDPRIGRWLSLDPMMAKYASQSPYAAFNNNPIYYADPTGLEGDPPGSMGTVEYGDILDDISEIENTAAQVATYDKAINQLKENIAKAQENVLAAKLYNETMKKVGGPPGKVMSQFGDAGITAAEVAIQGAQMNLNNMIKKRNNIANIHNDQIYSLVGGLLMDGEVSISEDIGALAKSELASGQGLLNFTVDNKLTAGFGDGSEGIDFTFFNFTSIKPTSAVDLDVALPNVPGKSSVVRKTKSNNKPLITNSDGNTVRSQQPYIPVKSPLLAPPSKSGNSWNSFLKAQKGVYSGKDWMQKVSSDYLYYKSKGAL